MSLRFSIFKHGLESILSSVDQVYDHWWLWVRSLTESAFLHPPKLASIPSRFRAMVSPFSIRYAICNAVQPYLSLDFRISAPKACINFFTISSDGSNNTITTSPIQLMFLLLPEPLVSNLSLESNKQTFHRHRATNNCPINRILS